MTTSVRQQSRTRRGVRAPDVCSCHGAARIELEAVGQGRSGRRTNGFLAAGVWHILIRSAGCLSEGQQVALAVAEERATLAVSLAGIVARDGHDVTVDREAGDIDRLEVQSARA